MSREDEQELSKLVNHRFWIKRIQRCFDQRDVDWAFSVLWSYNHPIPLWPVVHPEDLKPETACATFEGAAITADGVALLQKTVEGTMVETLLSGLGRVQLTADCELGWNWRSL
jgi:hypothetical protein